MINIDKEFIKRVKTKHLPRARVHPVSRKHISWQAFQNMYGDTQVAEKLRLWRSLPRASKPAKARLFDGRPLFWSECVQRYGKYFEKNALHAWYIQLPRLD